jgi:myo-inositol 2-dehydrogenase/D-chiro-inositol 1-dehydrogenase
MKAFFEAIKTGSETPVTGNDGLMNLAVGLAAKKSLAEHRPVKVSEVL